MVAFVEKKRIGGDGPSERVTGGALDFDLLGLAFVLPCSDTGSS
jgi:hypothetical protein